jgi:hypothetical protein
MLTWSYQGKVVTIFFNAFHHLNLHAGNRARKVTASRKTIRAKKLPQMEARCHKSSHIYSMKKKIQVKKTRYIRNLERQGLVDSLEKEAIAHKTHVRVRTLI